MSALFAPCRPWCNHRGRRRHWILIQISENQETEQQRGNKTGCEPFVLLGFFFIWCQVSSSFLSSGCQRSTRPSSFAAASPGNELMGLIWSQMESFGFRWRTDVREMCHQVLARWQRRGLTLEKIVKPGGGGAVCRVFRVIRFFTILHCGTGPKIHLLKWCSYGINT